jgi:hypothetical protein
MGHSWNAYRNYEDDVRKNNVDPVKLKALPSGSELISHQPRYYDAPAKVYRAPDGRIVEEASVNRGMWFIYSAFENDADWRGYQKPMSVNMYLHG